MECFIHFLGILKWDPRDRWTPYMALQHPFITRIKFDKNFKPEPDPITNIKEKTEVSKYVLLNLDKS